MDILVGSVLAWNLVKMSTRSGPHLKNVPDPSLGVNQLPVFVAKLSPQTTDVDFQTKTGS